ncbi:GH25 family lysozyme [Latilactobacillus sakei]|uniref:GH25 family lysozyme n=1 Tax=Latilactobacillus sakei TaxID=1599 RepID=UPI003F53BBD1
MKKNKLMKLVVATMAAILFAQATTGLAQAAKGDQGPDWSKYQGYSGKLGYATDKFVLIQPGGTYGGTYIDQLTYQSQVNVAKSNGLKVHHYLWYGVGGSSELGVKVVDRYMPQIESNAPKGSIVALDYEDGASGSVKANTDAVLAGMDRVARYGYTPMYYSYKPFTLAHIDYRRIIQRYPNSLCIAAYPNYSVTPKPNYAVFPSMDGIGIWQFTSTYTAGGLDGNVDLTGVTDSGYSKQPSKPVTPPSNNNQVANQDYAQNGTFTTNTTVNVRSGIANNSPVVATYAPGQSLNYNHIYIVNGVVKGRYTSYSGQQRYASLGLIPGQSFGTRTTTTTSRHYIIQYGDSFWSIANKLGVNMYTLAANNGKSINAMIYPGQTLSY